MTMTTTLTLNNAAVHFRVHPRTIVRALSDKINVFWNEDFNPLISVTALANAYSMNEKLLIRVLDNRDILLKPAEAAKEIKTPPRTFRWRGYKVAARKGGIVRYSRAQVINEELLRQVNQDI